MKHLFRYPCKAEIDIFFGLNVFPVLFLFIKNVQNCVLGHLIILMQFNFI